MSLREALDYYLPDLEVVSSTGLISSSLRVLNLPDPAQSNIDQVKELLAQHHLLLNILRDGYGFVSRDERELAAEPVLNGKADKAILASTTRRLLEEIVITRSNYHVGRAQHNVRHMDQRELDSLPSIGRDPLRAVTTLPGVSSNGVTAGLRLRGGNTDEVLYLLDGHKVIEPFHLRNFQSLFSAINPNIVTSASVSTSGFPSAFGGKMTALVEIGLDEAEEYLSGTVDLNFIGASASAKGRKGDFTWLASARRSVIDVILPNLKIDYGRPLFHDELLQLRWEGDTDSITGGLLNTADKISLNDERNAESGRSKYAYTSSWLNWDHKSEEDWGFTVKLGHVRVDASRRGVIDNPIDVVGSLLQDSNYRISTLASDWHWRFTEAIELQFGGEVEHQEGDFFVQKNAVYGELGRYLGQVDGASSTRQGRDGVLSSVYLNTILALSPSLRLQPGVRFDLQDVDTSRESLLSTRVRLEADFGDSSLMFFDLGRYTQAQNLYEVQLDDGKAELERPQYAEQLSVGSIFQDLDGYLIRAEAYYRKIHQPWSRFENIYDRWVILPELHADRIELKASEARAFGVELGVRRDMSEHSSWEVNYAYANAEDRIDGEWVKRSWNQRHTARLGLRSHWQGLNVSAFFSYHKGWPRTSLATGTNAALYTSTFPDYYSLDLHVDRVVELGRSKFTFYADISNASNRANVAGTRYFSDGDELGASKRKLLPILPVVGIRWEW
ncbi:MAG: TonB-dependent receptor plug domain-containing protein [Pseudomonadales bacterium]